MAYRSGDKVILGEKAYGEAMVQAFPWIGPETVGTVEADGYETGAQGRTAYSVLFTDDDGNEAFFGVYEDHLTPAGDP